MPLPVCPFIAANIKGEIPNLLPVRELISAPFVSNNFIMFTYPPDAAKLNGV